MLIQVFLSKPLPPILEHPPLLPWGDELNCHRAFLRPVGQWDLGQVVGAGPLLAATRVSTLRADYQAIVSEAQLGLGLTQQLLMRGEARSQASRGQGRDRKASCSQEGWGWGLPRLCSFR